MRWDWVHDLLSLANLGALLYAISLLRRYVQPVPEAKTDSGTQEQESAGSIWKPVRVYETGAAAGAEELQRRLVAHRITAALLNDLGFPVHGPKYAGTNRGGIFVSVRPEDWSDAVALSGDG